MCRRSALLGVALAIGTIAIVRDIRARSRAVVSVLSPSFHFVRGHPVRRSDPDDTVLHALRV